MTCNATPNFGLPLIDPAANADPATDINALANKTDDALKLVQRTGQAKQYVLPAATKNSLGGIIVGDGLNVDAAGKVTANVNPYVLPPASTTTLGGVMIGTGITLTPEGVISTDGGTVEIPDGAVTTPKIQDLAVTTIKIADGAVTDAKLATPLKALFNNASAFLSGQPQDIVTSYTAAGVTAENCSVLEWGRVLLVMFQNMPISAQGDVEICKITTTQANFGASLYQTLRQPVDIVNAGAHSMGVAKITGSGTTGTISVNTNIASAAAMTVNGMFAYLLSGAAITPA